MVGEQIRRRYLTIEQEKVQRCIVRYEMSLDAREFFDETSNSPDHEGPGCSVVLSFPSQTPPPAFSLRGE